MLRRIAPTSASPRSRPSSLGAQSRVHEEACAVLYELLRPYPRYAVFSGSAVLGTTPCSLGALARVLGLLDDAEAHLRTALEVAHELDAPFFVAEAEVELARVLFLRDRSDDQERARGLVARAREVAATRGFHAITRACDGLPA